MYFIFWCFVNSIVYFEIAIVCCWYRKVSDICILTLNPVILLYCLLVSGVFKSSYLGFLHRQLCNLWMAVLYLPFWSEYLLLLLLSYCTSSSTIAHFLLSPKSVLSNSNLKDTVPLKKVQTPSHYTRCFAG